MANWTNPNSITSATKIADTDDSLQGSMDDLQAFVNGTSPYSPATGLIADVVDKTSAQTISGSKTFSSAILANAGVTGNITGNITGDTIGNVKASNGTSVVLDNGTDGTDATFTGDVVGNADTATLAAAATTTTGNAGTATALETARNISLSGDATGTVSFDGTANVSIVTTVNDDSHSHSNYVDKTTPSLFSGIMAVGNNTVSDMSQHSVLYFVLKVSSLTIYKVSAIPYSFFTNGSSFEIDGLLEGSRVRFNYVNDTTVNISAATDATISEVIGS